MSQVYCKSPWTALFIHTDGQVKTCCAGTHALGNLNENTIEQILASEKLENIKKEIIAGKIPDYCSYCQKNEQQSGTSQRQYFEQFHVSSADPQHFSLQTVDVRWNTLCNLGCAYCNEDWSTTWQQIKGIPIKPMYHDYYQGFLDYLSKSKQTIDNFILAGGEPLLHKQNIKMLEQSKDDIVVDVITNLSVPLESSPVFRELKNKKNVRWQVSMDNIGDRFEYVRYGANWQQIIDNINTLLRLSNHVVTLFPLYCIYSATGIKEFMQLAKKLGVGVTWQKLNMPDYLNVNNFSRPIRQLAQQHIQEVLDQSQEQQQEFLQSVYYSLDQDPKKTVDQKFLACTRTYESRYTQQNRHFQLLWPEIYSLLENK